MIALIKHTYATVSEAIHFAVVIWHDARSMQAKAEQKYGHLGF